MNIKDTEILKKITKNLLGDDSQVRRDYNTNVGLFLKAKSFIVVQINTSIILKGWWVD